MNLCSFFLLFSNSNVTKRYASRAFWKFGRKRMCLISSFPLHLMLQKQIEESDVCKVENPSIIREQSPQAEGLIGWTGIWFEEVIGPFFFEESVTGRSYLVMLNDFSTRFFAVSQTGIPLFLCKTEQLHIVYEKFVSALVAEVLSNGLQGHLI